MRHMRQKLHSIANIGLDIWDNLDNLEQILLTYMINRGPASRSELANYTNKSIGTIVKRLNNLLKMGLIDAEGKTYAPNRTYKFIFR